MKKSVVIITGLLITNQAFADIGATNGVPDAATCNSGVLDTESGGVALQAQYIPETIALQWYDNNTLLNVTSTSSDSCTYNTSINLPTNPTKTGYKFTGWKVRPQYDFSTFDSTINAIQTWNKNPGGRCYTGSNGGTDQALCDNGDFDDLNDYEWKTRYSYGMVYGYALCSSTPGENTGDAGTPNEAETGIYCWIRATRFIPTNSNIKYAPTKSSTWAFVRNFSDSWICSVSCADYASAWATNRQGLRYTMFH